MANFKLAPTLNVSDYLYTAALGLPGARLTSLDKNKLVKLIATDTYGLTAAGDEIEAAVNNVEDTAVNGTIVNGTVKSGSGLGTIQTGHRLDVWLETAVAIGGYVVAGDPVALGTALGAATGELPAVKAGAPTKFLWRVVSGTGAANSRAVIEKI